MRARSIISSAVGATALIAALSAAACAPSPTLRAPANLSSPTTTSPSSTTAPTTRSASATATLPDATSVPRITLRQTAGGLDHPLFVASPGDGSGRLFIVEKTGRIRVLRGGRLLAAPFLDLSASVSAGSEQGLLGLAFSPDYAHTGRFYVDYTDRSGDTVVARYTAATGSSVADAHSARVVLHIAQPFPNHNGGCIQFGPDGMLYVGMGDGGSAGDPNNNAQSPSTLLGKMLRIDVEGAASSPRRGYFVPKDNPFVGDSRYRPEIYQLGLRNPWRFSFDRKTGELYTGDVGQNLWEEVDVTPAGRGGQNLGWRVWEGDHPYPPGSGAPRNGFTFPVFEYSHAYGDAVVGGYVYRGTAQPAMRGVYFFSDNGSGNLWAMLTSGAHRYATRLIATTGHAVSGFGQDESGELYLCDLSAGTVWRRVATP